MSFDRDNKVYLQVRALLLRGEFEPGQPINITDVSKKLLVSPLPVREALIRLSERGVINSFKGRGFFVNTYTHDELTHLLHTLLNILLAELQVFLSAQQLQVRLIELKSFVRSTEAPLEIADRERIILRVCSKVVSPCLSHTVESLLDITFTAREFVWSHQASSADFVGCIIRVCDLALAGRAQQSMKLATRICRIYLRRMIAVRDSTIDILSHTQLPADLIKHRQRREPNGYAYKAFKPTR